jgi:hypothetical protein
MMTVKEFFEYMDGLEFQKDLKQDTYYESLYGSSVAAKLCEKTSPFIQMFLNSSEEGQPKPMMQEVETFRKVNWK